MKKTKILSILTILILLITLVLPYKAFAENSSKLILELTTLKEQVKAGDKINVKVKVNGDSIASLTGVLKYNLDEFEEIKQSDFKLSTGFSIGSFTSDINRECVSFLLTTSNDEYIKPDNGIVATITMTAREDIVLSQNTNIYLKADIDAEEDYYEAESEIFLITNDETGEEEVDDLYLTTEQYKIGSANTKRYESGDKYLSRISPETTISEFKSNVETNGTIQLYDKDQNEITDDVVLVATGMKLKVTKENCEDINLDLSVVADIDCNAKVTATDLAGMNQQILKEIQLQGVQFISADISEDDRVTATDLAAIIQVILKDLVV